MIEDLKAIAIIVAIGLVILLAGHAVVKAHHMDVPGNIAQVNTACPTLDGAIAVVEAQTEDARWTEWEVYGCASTANPRGMEVAIHAIVGEVVWGADGLDDMMFIIHAYDRRGSEFYSWLIKADVVELYPDILRALRNDPI